MVAPVYVVGSGTYLPGEPIPAEAALNALGRLAEAPRSIQRWIERTGPVLRELLDIDFVHYAFDPVTRQFTDDNLSMSVKAARAALDRAQLSPQHVDLICYGSAQLNQMPTTSVRIQQELGIEACDELSIHANCTSAYKALYLAHQLVRQGRNRTALVLSSNVSSSELVSEYYNQQQLERESLFLRWFLCDGAGALVVSSRRPQGGSAGSGGRSSGGAGWFELEATYIESVGGRRPSLMYNELPARCMPPQQVYQGGLHHLRQRFRDELATATFQEPDGSVFVNGLRRMVRRESVPLERVRYAQINLPAKHIVASVQDELERLGIPRRALYSKLDTLGYCGPPMALIGLDQILRHEAFGDGDRVVSFVTEVSKFMQAGYSVRHVAAD